MKTDFKRKFIGIIGSVVMLAGLLPGIVAPAAAVAADPPPTTSIHVVKYASDGTTVIDETTIDIATMESTLPPQGDGVTHYYTQGPTFDPANLWDPAETCPGDSLKDKGALRGTNVADLCDLVGGAVAGDTISVTASDGYGETFQYENVYEPLTNQGPMVITWYNAEFGYSGSGWNSGMMLAFFPETPNSQGKYLFGHQDMHDCLPEANWHYYYDGSIEYPSTHGLYIKFISEVSIVEGGTSEWSIDVTGAMTQAVSQGWFENALACHETASWTDADGHVWSGLPLWYLVGLSDDTTIHGPGAFNDALATAGYDIQVTAADGYSKTFASALVARSNAYIVADKVDGVALGESSYPLRLVGSALTSNGQRVGKIASINLRNIPVINTWSLALEGASDYTMTQAEFESGVNCTTNNHSATFTNADGTYKGLPLWLLCGWVDDGVQHGEGAFSDALAAAGYQVKVTASDGYYFTFGSADVARNDGIIVANTLNDAPLPDGSYPLRLIGDGFAGGSGWQVREITTIELLNLPVPSYTLTVNTSGSGSVTKNPDQATYASGTPVELTATPAAGFNFTGWSGSITSTDNPVTVTMDASKTVTATFTAQQWSLQLNGMTKLTVSQADFESLATAYPMSCVVTNKDGSQDTYSGVALFRLVGKVDDGDAATMNSTYAAKNYPISTIASDGFSKSLTSTQVLNSDTYIVANTMNGAPLPSDKAPLRIVWQGNTSGGMVSKLATIQFAIPWEIQLVGASTTTVTNTQFETSAAANPVSWVDGTNNTWSGLALWRLIGLVDDADPATFNDALAAIGYSVKITASDNFNKTFAIADIARNDNRIIASKINNYWLAPDKFPARFVGPSLSNGQMVSKIVSIELIGLPTVYTITASAGANGSITPSGNVVVTSGSSQTFNIAANTNYHVVDVLVDGASVGPVASYTFPQVTVNHTIAASFAIDTFTITASAGANGSISPSGKVTVAFGTDPAFTIAPNIGCQIADVLVDGVSVGPVASYTFDTVSSGHTIAASFFIPMNSFSVRNMSVDYDRRDDKDSINLTAQFSLPGGVTVDPKKDEVRVNIDGFAFSIPAGSFKGSGKEWTYNSRGNAQPKINMLINTKKGEMTLEVSKADVDVINNYDGVRVTFSIGSIVGQQNISMFVDSLSYPRVH